MTVNRVPGSHLWLTAYPDDPPAGSAATFGRHDGHRRLRGPFTAAGSLVRAIVADLVHRDPDLVRRHDLEILAAAPELADVVVNSRTTLTSEAEPSTRTRFYPHDRSTWIGHGLTDLVLAHASALGGGQSVWFDHVDRLDPTDSGWLAGLLRRSDPAVLQIVCTSGARATSTDGATTALDEALARYTRRVPAALGAVPPGHHAQDRHGPGCLARHFVAGHGTSADPAAISEYEALPAGERAALHDAQAEALVAPHHLDGTGLSVWRRGALAYHLEHGSDPVGRGVDALALAQQESLLAGWYEAVVDLGHRARALLSWADDGERCWLATVKMTIAMQAMGRPDEAMDLFDDACSNSTAASVHMQSAYGRAMVYTRYYEPERRDLRRAKGLINTAIALAGLSTDEQRRAYNRTFNENGLALVEMHRGETDTAVELIETGIARLDREVEGGRYLLHRSVLRYNHAQLMVRCGRIEDALTEYGRLIEEDPHHPDYWFDRGALHERLGHVDEAIADFAAAAIAGPPYAEPYYNQAELLAQTGEVAAAIAGFGRVLELEPTYVDAWVNRASLRLGEDDLDGAAADVAAGLALDAENPHLLCLSGQIAQQRRQFDRARIAFDAAVRVDPTMAAAWANLGVLHYETGDAAGAARCLRQSLDLDDDPDVRDNLALALAG